VPSGIKKVKYNAVCVENEDSVIALLNEELDIDSDDELDLENVEETASEELSDEMSESESESKTSVLLVDRWEDVMKGDKKLKAYTFSKNSGPQYNLLLEAEPMDYFSIFFNDELLDNIVTERNRYVRHKFQNFSLAQGPFGVADLMCQFLK
jgi:hypothetical protein